MKDFLKRILMLFAIAFLGLNVIGYMRVQPPFIEYMNKRKGGWLKVYERINRSKTKINTKRVYIGDSVGNQLFNFEKTPNSLTSNAAVSIAGNYILIQNLLENNPQISEIILLSVPNDIGWNFEQKLTHNNFVKPFLTFGNLGHFNSTLKEKINQKPNSWLYLSFGIKILPFSDIDFSNNEDKESVQYLEEIKLTTLSDIAIDYIKLLNELCLEKNIKLTVISPPVPVHWKVETNDWEEMKKQVTDHKLSDIMKGYFESIMYYPDDYFHDGLHLKNTYIKESRDSILSHIDI